MFDLSKYLSERNLVQNLARGARGPKKEHGREQNCPRPGACCFCWKAWNAAHQVLVTNESHCVARLNELASQYQPEVLKCLVPISQEQRSRNCLRPDLFG